MEGCSASRQTRQIWCTGCGFVSSFLAFDQGFQLIAEAYEVLSKPSTRSEYDEIHQGLGQKASAWRSSKPVFSRCWSSLVCWRSDGETASYKSSQQKQATLAALQGGVGFIVWFHCGKKVLGALTRYTLSQADIHPCSCTISEPVSKTWPCTWRLGLWLQGCFSRFQQKELDFLGVSCATAIDPVMKNIPYHCSLLFTCHKPCRICAAVLLPAVTLFASVATHAPHAPLHAIVSSQESCQDGESQWGSRQKYVR